MAISFGITRPAPSVCNHQRKPSSTAGSHPLPLQRCRGFFFCVTNSGSGDAHVRGVRQHQDDGNHHQHGEANEQQSFPGHGRRRDDTRSSARSGSMRRGPEATRAVPLENLIREALDSCAHVMGSGRTLAVFSSGNVAQKGGSVAHTQVAMSDRLLTVVRHWVGTPPTYTRPAKRAARRRAVVARLQKSDAPRCGARRRDGGECQARPAWDTRRGRPLHGGRCRLHGGLSTGPRSAAGRAAIAESNRRRAAASSVPSTNAPSPDTCRRRATDLAAG
jgi:hypothetical protein